MLTKLPTLPCPSKESRVSEFIHRAPMTKATVPHGRVSAASGWLLRVARIFATDPAGTLGRSTVIAPTNSRRIRSHRAIHSFFCISEARRSQKLQPSKAKATPTQPYNENFSSNHSQARNNGTCGRPATSRRSRYTSTRELQAMVTASVTRLTSCNHCRVGARPQRPQTDCWGQNCNPQSSQNTLPLTEMIAKWYFIAEAE
jgi:hypothetical protein